ncbi:ABC transporter permease [Jonesia denitrificans]|uniref:ABC transporter permease n=1 Tax=Jonesia denitrificans TaxID=43674 RepID=UPI0002DE37D1|nr:iron ABC transporter permease [Jonesia denitrificans]ASE08322.2 iron ABC transporter permease [Jonesia denitrificans]QXB42921.1 iron ABC transporter permease [Jonesia denitrificans]
MANHAPTLRRATLWGAAAVVPLVFLTVFFAWPVTALIARGFLTDGALDLSGITTVLTTPRTWRLLGITLAQGVVGTLVALLLGIPGAYVLYRCTFPGRTLVRGLVTIPFVLPTVVVGVAFRALLSPNGPLGFLAIDGTFTAVIAALVFFNYSVVVRTVGSMWEKIDPRTAEAARALGASRNRAWWTVTVPQLMPAITSAGAVVFLFCATAFGTVMVLGGQGYGTIETEIWVQTVQFLDLRTAAVLSVLQLLVIATALWISATARTRQERALTLLTATITGRPLTWRRDWFPTLITLTTTTGLLAWPLLNLTTAAFRDANGNWTLTNFTALTTRGDNNTLNVTVFDALTNSLIIAFYATLTALIIGGLVAYVASRRPTTPTGKRAITTLDALFMLPLGVSAVTVGFGFLITLNQPLGLPIDLRTNGILVPIAQAVVATPLVVRTVLPVLRAIDPNQHHAAATLGAPGWKIATTIDWPIAARALALATGMAFAVSLGEFGATAFLARPDTATLPIVIFRLISKPGADNYGMALAASLILALLTATIMMIAERWRTPTTGTLT